MKDRGDHVEIETDEVRGGESSGRMWKVLVIGTFLAAALMTIIWVTGALSQGDVESAATVSGTQDAMNDDDGTGTDGVIEPEDVQ